MQTHQNEERDNGKVMVLAWMDKRVVKVISSKQDARYIMVNRRIGGGHKRTEHEQKSICVIDYNKHMSGIDQVDQMILLFLH